MEQDSYLTVRGSARAQFVEQRSRFISFAYHVTSAQQVKECMAALQKEYYDARHICYAYMLGAERIDWRANDNGEPSGTAGKPIMGQINSAGLTDILIAVVRYFGGVKLGTSGLIEAYRMAAQMAIEASEVVTAYVEKEIVVYFGFDQMNSVMKVAKDCDLRILEQGYEGYTAHEPKTDSRMEFQCSMTMRGRAQSIQGAALQLDKITEPMPVPALAYYITNSN